MGTGSTGLEVVEGEWRAEAVGGLVAEGGLVIVGGLVAMGGLVIVGGLVAAGCGEVGEWPTTRVASGLGPWRRDNWRVGAVASRVASIEWLRASSILRGEWLARRGASAEWQIASVASRVASTGWRGAPSEWLSSRDGAAAADERTAFAGTDTMVVVVRVANRTKYQL